MTAPEDRPDDANLRSTMHDVADELRDVAEMWLYNGDTYQPLNAGYDAVFGLADRLDYRAALSVAPQPQPGGER